MSTVTFRATIERSGMTATGIEVPADDAAAVGSGQRPPVHATIAGHTFDGMPYGHKLRSVLSVEGAETHETRRRGIAKAVDTPRSERR